MDKGHKITLGAVVLSTVLVGALVLTKTEPKVVTKTVMQVVTPTLAPTATPSATLAPTRTFRRLPVISLTPSK